MQKMLLKEQGQLDSLGMFRGCDSFTGGQSWSVFLSVDHLSTDEDEFNF